MIVKIQTSPLSSGNTGSCKQLVNYLRKEDDLTLEEGKKAVFFFSESKEFVFPDEVVKAIDQNAKGGLRSDEAKFYSIVLAPSQQELEHIGNDTNKLKAYTRAVMQAYAENFNKGLNSEDLVWFAKIEQERHYKGFDVIPEGKRQGDKKEGLQTHIHVIVSRKTIDGKKISPLANQRGTEIITGTGQRVTAGFDREKFRITCVQLFDKLFQYDYNLSIYQQQTKRIQEKREITIQNK